MDMWIATYYVAGRFGSMLERTRTYPSNLTQSEVTRRLQQHFTSLRRQGTAVYPQFDLQLERLAS